MATITSERGYKPGEKRTEISSTPTRPIDSKKQKQELSNIFETLGDSCDDSLKEMEASHQNSIEEAVMNAFVKHGLFQPSEPKLPNIPPSKSGVQGDSLASVINSVLSAIQPMIMKAVSVAIASTTATVLDKMQQDMQALQLERAELRELKTELQQQKFENEKLEQYTRKDNVRIFGLSETENEDLDDKIISLAGEIGLELKKDDISVSHRLRGNGKKPRPAIVKFVKRSTKANLMTKKKKLKNIPHLKDIYISDDLTRLRNNIVREMKDDPNILRVWTRDGKINCVAKYNEEEVKIVINSCADVSKLHWDDDRLKKLGTYLEL